jgi:hypothetical protein
MTDDVELIKCPGCDLQLPIGDLQTQAAHMQAEHPEVIEGRLERAGFERDDKGEWQDMLSPMDEFRPGNIDVAMEPGLGGTWSADLGEVEDDRPEGLLQIQTQIQTPDHDFDFDAGLRVYERYTGLHDQARVGLVDGVGRVWHYDLDEVTFRVMSQLRFDVGAVNKSLAEIAKDVRAAGEALGANLLRMGDAN